MVTRHCLFNPARCKSAPNIWTRQLMYHPWQKWKSKQVFGLVENLRFKTLMFLMSGASTMQGAVLCLAQAAQFLFSGGQDSTIKVWQFDATSQAFQPLVSMHASSDKTSTCFHYSSRTLARQAQKAQSGMYSNKWHMIKRQLHRLQCILLASAEATVVICQHLFVFAHAGRLIVAALHNLLLTQHIMLHCMSDSSCSLVSRWDTDVGSRLTKVNWVSVLDVLTMGTTAVFMTTFAYICIE